MRPTSAQQYEASVGGTLPEPEEVRDGIWAVSLPLPNGSVPYTLSYLIEDSGGDVHVLDPGWNSEENWRRLGEGLAAMGKRLEQVRSATSTHLHPDHIGMAAELRQRTGASVALDRREQEAIRQLHESETPVEDQHEQYRQWGVPAERIEEVIGSAVRTEILPSLEADLLLDDGDRLAIAGRAIDVVSTPGHTTGHICLADEENGLLYTGDHVLPTVYPGLGLGGTSANSPLGDYIQSVAKVEAYADFEACPGHGYRFRGLVDRCRTIAEHHLRRTSEIEAVIRADPNLSVWETASRVSWSAGFENLKDMFLQSALSQTKMHLDYLEATHS
ncbi:MBL fold metallo-hydrolase [soil metagenome]